MNTDGDHCVLRWCQEAGIHQTHRQYVASINAGGRRANMIGVNLIQDDRPDATFLVEITSTRAPLTSLALVPGAAADMAQAIATTAESALNHQAQHMQTKDEPHLTSQ
ncbi:hypothetical protein [Jiangella rhizosphaerae]|uniref:Uncharacterized protein n=1 Tax=Jiangella rhizosphaerae TaxID=2293569 RepID=A0A418KSY0_9ACTN|nr:hypothetical protein [Jiangella rhizosphaerae]RIQ29147.1 hypothetical protein DY240_08775 [Jiangella rhizosphaerae]